MDLKVYPEDLNERGKELNFAPDHKGYFLPSVQVVIEQVIKSGGRVIYYACDGSQIYQSVT